MNRKLVIFLAVLALSAWALFDLTHPQTMPSTNEYTADEVMDAYMAGQFRVIQTRSPTPYISPDGVYVIAHIDGLYRISDGAFIDSFDGVLDFSPDRNYFVQRREGVYRSHDLQLIMPITAEGISIASGEHVVLTGNAVFSPNSAYVAIEGAGIYRPEAESQDISGYGVFRLSDGQQIVQTDSRTIIFSSDSTYVATQDGIFRLSDGQRLYDNDGGFSPDSAYAYVRYDGLYRLSDGARLFSINTHTLYFSPDSRYAVVSGDGVYRLPEGQRVFEIAGEVAPFSVPRFNASNEYAVITLNLDPTSEARFTSVYRLRDGVRLFEEIGTAFSPDGTLIAVSADGVYRLSDGQKLFDIHGQIDSWGHFSDDGVYLYAEYDGIYRVADGQRIFEFDRSSWNVTFSPDWHYIAIDDAGVYRLSDQQRLFDIHEGSVRFTNNHYIQVYTGFDQANLSTYRIRDGRRYEHVEVLDVEAGILRVGNAILDTVGELM